MIKKKNEFKRETREALRPGSQLGDSGTPEDNIKSKRIFEY